MLVGKLRTAAAAALALGIFTVGIGSVAWVAAQDSSRAVDDANIDMTTPNPFVKPSQRTALGLKESDEIWSMTLRQAIAIGLDNSSTVRLLSIAGKGVPLKVAPRDAAADADAVQIGAHRGGECDRAAVLESSHGAHPALGGRSGRLHRARRFTKKSRPI